MANERLLALDVFRGMTIFFMIIVNSPGSWSHIYSPLRHAEWHGCTPTDLVFPFFLFIVGVSMAFSYRNFIEKGEASWVRKAIKRTLLIFLIGLLLNWFPFYNKSLADLRIFGVLQRIALSFGVAALTIHFVSKKWLSIILVAILFMYWAIMYFYGGTDPYSLENNFARVVDLKIIGENHMYGGFGIPFDPEGILSSIPGVATVILGYLLGTKLLDFKLENKSILKMLGIGSILTAVGLLWHYIGFPINKPLWTSSYVLFSGGLAIISLTLLIWIIDNKKITNWIYPFKTFGLNPLISFVASIIVIKIMFMIKISEMNLYGYMYKNIFQNIFGDTLGSFLQALSFGAFIFLFAWYLYRKGKIIKV